MRKWLALLVFVSGCGVDAAKWKGMPKERELEGFIDKAVAKTGTELKRVRRDDPSMHAWDDVPLDQLPDSERAEKEFPRAKYLTAEVMLNGELWNVQYRQYGDAWMLTNVSLAIVNKRVEILYVSMNNDPIDKVKAHPVFQHFIPPKHAEGKKAHDAIKARMK